MKKSIKISAIAVAAMMLLTLFAACASSEEAADLVVTYYEGGYGKEWLEHAASAFEEANDVKIKLISSSKLNCDAPNYIKSERNLSDLYIAAASSWNSWVAEGKLESLADVYETEVNVPGGKAKIKDFMDQDVIGKFYMQRRAGQGDFLPWVMPWSAQPGALAYNMDLLPKVTHTDSGYAVDGLSVGAKWTTPPATVTELLAYCADVNAYGDDSGYTYKPFGWSGQAPEMFYYMIYTWWAQAQGVFESNFEGEGSFYDFWNFGNTAGSAGQTFSLAGFAQSGIARAIDTLRGLIVSDGEYVNSLADAARLTSQQLEQTFVSADVNVKPAIILASSYLEYETRINGYLDSNKDGVQDVHFEFVQVPRLDGYEGDDVVYCMYEDVMFVPNKAAHKETAKQFLAFLCNVEQLNYFSATTGGIRPFNYDARDAGANYSDFSRSVFDIYYNGTHVFEYPLGTEWKDVSYVYRFERPTLFGVTALPTVVNQLKTMTGAEIMKDVSEQLNRLSVSNWLRKYGMTSLD